MEYHPRWSPIKRPRAEPPFPREHGEPLSLPCRRINTCGPGRSSLTPITRPARPIPSARWVRPGRRETRETLAVEYHPRRLPIKRPRAEPPFPREHGVPRSLPCPRINTCGPGRSSPTPMGRQALLIPSARWVLTVPRELPGRG